MKSRTCASKVHYYREKYVSLILLSGHTNKKTPNCDLVYTQSFHYATERKWNLANGPSLDHHLFQWKPINKRHTWDIFVINFAFHENELLFYGCRAVAFFFIFWVIIKSFLNFLLRRLRFYFWPNIILEVNKWVCWVVLDFF